MDLTQFMHAESAEIHICCRCGVLRRQEQARTDYESDRYDTALMRHLYPRYRRAFEQKLPQFDSLLAPGANVLEVGSHYGAFLEAAETWGWKPVGLDVGRDTSAFARRQGGTVKRMALGEYRPSAKLDAIFIWNCFEQFDDAWEPLVNARSLLRRHAPIVLRVPNGDFYRRRPSLRLAGYNNLLAFPYLNGYNRRSLASLLDWAGFEPIAYFPSSILTPAYPDLSRRIQKEWRLAQSEPDATSPWIELVGRLRAES